MNLTLKETLVTRSRALSPWTGFYFLQSLLINFALGYPFSLLYAVAGSALVFLALLGALAAHTGGAGMAVGAWRVTFWGALAMAITAGGGAWFGAPV